MSQLVCTHRLRMLKPRCKHAQALKFFVYFGLYYTLPHDRIEELAEPEPASGAAGSGPDGWVLAGKEPAEDKPPPGGVSGAAGGSLRGGIALATLRSVGLTPCKAEYSSLPSTPDAKLRARIANGGDWISPAGGRRRSHQDLTRAVSEDSTEEGGSWRSASLGSVSRYIAVELTQLPPAGTAPLQPCATARKGDATV